MKALVLNRIALVLAFTGIYISGVLSIGAHFAASIPCGASHGCDAVALHKSSHALGIPNAYIGFVAYIVLAAFAYWRLVSPASGHKTLVIGYVMTALGTLASLALTYVAIAIIGATCIWCLSSAAVMIILLIVHSLLMQSGESVQAVPTSDPSEEPAEYPRGGGAQRESSMADGIVLAVLVLGSLFALGVQWANISEERHGGIVGGVVNVDPKVVLPAGAHTYGDPAAPMTIVEFGDLLCPLCKDQFSVVQDFVGKHKGQIKYVFRHYPVINAKGHEQSAPAAIASEMAAEKGDFWPFLTVIYGKEHGDIKDINDILDLVKGFGFDPAKALVRIRDGKDKAFQRVVKDMDDAARLGVHGTPTFFILAPGVPIRVLSDDTLMEKLDGDEYKKFLKVGKK